MLENLKIAKPCPADWNAMTGDDRVRFCKLCKLNVYNLSGMTRSQAEDLLTKNEGSVCVRLFQRADGTVLTKDCPVGLAALRRRVASVAASVAALCAIGFSFFSRTGDPVDGSKVERPTNQPRMLMGAAPCRPDLAPRPEVKTPEVKTPEVKTPEVKTPEIKTREEDPGVEIMGKVSIEGEGR